MADDPFAAIAEPASAPGGADPFASIAEPGDQFAANAASVAEQNSKAQPQTSGFFKQLMSPYNTAAAEFGEKHPVLGIPVRTAAAAAGALAQTGPAIYHAFADAPTEEEKKKFGEEETQGLKRVGLGLHRLVVDPVASAASDYASGKVTPKAALSVLPEAIGVGIGSQAASEIGARGLSKVGELRTTMKEGVQPFARKFTGVEGDLKKNVTQAAEKTAAAEEAHAEATDTAVQRQGLAKKLDETSMKAREHIGKVEASVAKEANAKFDAVRAKIGNPETEAKPLVDAVKSAEENILQGIPENIKEFRSIIGHGEDVPVELQQAYAEATGAMPEGPQPITWDKLQSLKSRIDSRLRNGGRLNGDLKRALYSVQDTIVNTMGDVAEQHGGAELWSDARKSWRQYKEDFHEPTGPSGSGSPVAKALDAVDPKNIRQPFAATQSTLGNRGVDILRKYPQHGGTEAAATVEEMMGHHENLRKMGSDKAIKPVKTPTVDALQASRDSIAKKAANWGSFNARDVGIIASGGLGELIGGLFGGSLPERILGAATGVGAYEGGKYAMSRALNNPKVVSWLEKTPKAEYEALQKIPGADKVRIINAVTDAVIKSGKPVKLSPAAQQLIGPANVARIAAATGAVSGTRVQNRKDALDLLNSPTAP